VRGVTEREVSTFKDIPFAERPSVITGGVHINPCRRGKECAMRPSSGQIGDPNKVTIFGFSAGGVSVHSLLSMLLRPKKPSRSRHYRDQSGLVSALAICVIPELHWGTATPPSLTDGAQISSRLARCLDAGR
jgi:hypothetical protein